ncbi:PREDICTED: cap-specific mRNA (nucleoside-2'-O-)-methyltransferase 2 [Ceratosolen solmsi marchali]|uniref:Cap-specific mRNA (nucleoside-2'-O-)-methyltransferase 2 n=1 Tax=Ceratosolen solmsi marchali TaxID=326594 RepID=A0AAJ7E338_9HYME|nr:PREDICTED: cap-specific mRNA (nucleoside-2'-O-)-methyltransferase 2 [Ceratosolen solmsi marchali]
MNCQNHNEFQLNDLLTIVNKMFEKSFVINDDHKYTLPKPESMFVEQHWKIEELQKIKTDLNEIKSKLNNYCYSDWHVHTAKRNKAKNIQFYIQRHFHLEFVTQAWCKFHEIISKYPLIRSESILRNNNKFVSLHLCEAPGAFISCLNHWLKTNFPLVDWNWLAMTLNPYYEGNCNNEMISDDRFIVNTLENWFFGHDGTGNLMNIENLDALVEKIKHKGKVDLITADGSVNCVDDPGEQEKIVANLHFCEVVAAVHMLNVGGSFVLKIFTIFEHQSICLIYFLSCIFKKVHFYKPVTSKEGNSEVYVICLEFEGLEFVGPYLPILRTVFGKHSDTAIFKKNDIPVSFITQIISCAQLFKDHQCQVIEDNIASYNGSTDANDNAISKKIFELVVHKFVFAFPLQILPAQLQIVGNSKLRRIAYKCWESECQSDSFSERQKKQLLKPIDCLLNYTRCFINASKPLLQTFVFKSNQLQIKTCVTVGKPFKRINNSRFCTVQTVDIFNLLFEIAGMEQNVELYLPTKEDIMEYEIKIKKSFNDSYKIIHFRFNELYKNDEIITLIKETLTKLQKGDNLILLGFLLLTQFNVGIIYLLANTFHSVEFNTNEEVGYSVILKNFISEDLILQEIEQIHKIAKDVNKSNAIVFSIISITELYDSELYPIIVNLNKWISQYCLNFTDFVHKYKQCAFSQT